MNAAMMGGEVDMAVIGAAPGANAVAQGIPIKVIYVIDYSTAAEGLVARSPIDDVKGLIGKKIATPFVSSSHFGLLTTLNLAGIGLDQVKIVDMRPADMLAAWHQKNIDAAFIWSPHLTRMASMEGKILYTSGDIAEATKLTRAAWDIVYARAEFVEKYPELVEAYVRAVDRAVKRYQSNPPRSSGFRQKSYGCDNSRRDEIADGRICHCNGETTIGTAMVPGIGDDFACHGCVLQRDGAIGQSTEQGRIRESYVHQGG